MIRCPPSPSAQNNTLAPSGSQRIHLFAARWIDAFCFLAVGTDYPSFSKRFCLNTLIARGWLNSPKLWQFSGIGNTCADTNPIALRNSSLKVPWTCQSEVRIGVDPRSGNQHNLETDKQDNFKVVRARKKTLSLPVCNCQHNSLVYQSSRKRI